MNPDNNRFEPVFTKEDRLTRERRLLEEEHHDTSQEQARRLKQLGSKLETVQQQAASQELEKIRQMLVANPGGLVRADGSPVPSPWAIFSVGEQVVIKNYTFKVAYVGETSILFEPVGPVLVGAEGEP